MKKVYLLLLVFAAFCLVGCGGSEETKDNSEGENIAAKKTLYIDLTSTFLSASRTKVNEGMAFRFYDTSKLYLIPVGNEDNSCVPVTGSTKSPFSSKWNYAYVGVVYNGYGYDYYFVSEDGEGYGIPFVGAKTLSEKGKDLLEKDVNKSFSSTLIKEYTSGSNDTHTLTAQEKEIFKEALNGSITTVLYISPKTCKN